MAAVNRTGVIALQSPWQAIILRTDYLLWVDDLTTGQSNLLPNQTTATAFFQLPSSLPKQHRYRIWLLARNSRGAGAWSSPIDVTDNRV